VGLAPVQQVALLGTPTPQSSLASPAQAHALEQNCEQVPQGERASSQGTPTCSSLHAPMPLW